MADPDRKLLAVLIDADNIPARFARAILKEITSFGEPALRRVYGDWSSAQLQQWSKQVHELGLVSKQETANTKGKNASDIGLVIDAMDILHTRRFDGFVIVSSDSDFTALANRIREDGLEMIGIGEAKAPISLRNVCNRFILIENIVDSDDTMEKDGASTSKTKKQPETKAVPIILKAMERIAQDEEWYSLAPLGKQLIADNPDFDTRTYGKPKLSDLLDSLKRFELDRSSRQIRVRRLD